MYAFVQTSLRLLTSSCTLQRRWPCSLLGKATACSRLAIGTFIKICERESGDMILLRIAQIQRCVQVSVFCVTACGTNIDAVFEFQAAMHMPAGVAGLGTRVESVRDAELDPDDSCLAPQLLAEGVEALLRHDLREMAVLHHAGHVEVFHRDEAWFLLHQCVDDLILVIAAEIRQPLMQSLYR